MLFREPQVYYQINRKLRSLANHDEILLKDQLSQLLPRDFLANDYQVLMRLFIEALEQQDYEAHEYLQANITPSLKDTLDQLMKNDVSAELKKRLNNRFSADIQTTVKLMMVEWTEAQIIRESLLTALRLRRFRLLQEVQEYKIMLADFDSKEDEYLFNEMRIRIKYLAKAMGAIDRGIEETMKM